MFKRRPKLTLTKLLNVYLVTYPNGACEAITCERLEWYGTVAAFHGVQGAASFIAMPPQSYKIILKMRSQLDV